jgi:hypothetical protein
MARADSHSQPNSYVSDPLQQIVIPKRKHRPKKIGGILYGPNDVTNKEDFMTDVFVADRSVQLEKLKLDIATATANAEQHGIALPDIIVTLLQRGEDLCQLGAERGLDLSRVKQFFGADA